MSSFLKYLPGVTASDIGSPENSKREIPVLFFPEHELSSSHLLIFSGQKIGFQDKRG
jgi:hypothetical protein